MQDLSQDIERLVRQNIEEVLNAALETDSPAGQKLALAPARHARACIAARTWDNG